VKTGSLYEGSNPGISHFLEHLHFRKLGGKTQKQLYYEIESLGAYFGACTYKEYMQFYLTASPNYFSALAGIASDLLGSLEADEKDFSAERKLVMSEFRENNPNNDIDDVSNQIIWQGTNLQNPILGSISSVKKLTLQMLQNEKEQAFTRHNMFFYVTGRFNDSDIAVLLKEIERHDLSGRIGPQNNDIAQSPANFAQRAAFAKISQRKFYMNEVKISFDVDFAKVNRPDLIYLDNILTNGLCSLLRTELIEKRGLIYDISSVIEQYRNIGTYYFTFTVAKSGFFEALKNFVAVIKTVKKDISEADMKTTRVFKTDNQIQLLDDPEGLNWSFAYVNHILDNTYHDISELAGVYRQITRQQLLETANEVFLANNAMLVSIGTKKGLSETRCREMLSEI
jgi:predicted Zn-dependent peptidase